MTDDHYITVLPTSNHYYFIVVEMRYRRGADDYIQGRCSMPLKGEAAKALAESWAAAMKLEIR